METKDQIIYIGIDPGLKGAMCLLFYPSMTCKIVDFESEDGMDKEEILVSLHTAIKMDMQIFCCIEKQVAAPGQGVSSTLTTGKNYGWLLGALCAFNITHEEIPAKRWMKDLGIKSGMEVKARKTAIADMVKGYFPEVEFYGPKGGLKDGRSDACAIARYAMNTI